MVKAFVGLFRPLMIMVNNKQMSQVPHYKHFKALAVDRSIDIQTFLTSHRVLSFRAKSNLCQSLPWHKAVPENQLDHSLIYRSTAQISKTFKRQKERICEFLTLTKRMINRKAMRRNGKTPTLHTTLHLL